MQAALPAASTLQLLGQSLMHQALAGCARQAGEAQGDHLDIEMGEAPLFPAPMAPVEVGLIGEKEMLGAEGGPEQALQAQKLVGRAALFLLAHGFFAPPPSLAFALRIPALGLPVRAPLIRAAILHPC